VKAKLQFRLSILSAGLLLAMATSVLFLRINPDASLIRRGNQAYARGDYAKAADIYERARMTSDGGETLLLRELEARLEAADFRKAGKNLELLIVLNPENPDYRKRLAAVYQALGEADQAVATWNEYLAMRPADREGYYELAMAMSRNGNTEKAKILLKRLLEEDPEDMRTLLALGKLHAWDGNYELAVDSFRKVLSIYPRWVEPRIYLARVLSWMGDFESSVMEYREALKEYS